MIPFFIIWYIVGFCSYMGIRKINSWGFPSWGDLIIGFLAGFFGLFMFISLLLNMGEKLEDYPIFKNKKIK